MKIEEIRPKKNRRERMRQEKKVRRKGGMRKK